MDHSHTVASLTLSDRLSALPDDILGQVLSYMTLSDSVKTRLLSARWRYLFDNRSDLLFDSRNVLGFSHLDTLLGGVDKSLGRSKFVRGVDELLEIWKDRKLTALKVYFILSGKEAAHIDSWVQSGLAMNIETLDLKLIPIQSEEDYVLTDQLFYSGKAFKLKHLRLQHCALTFSSDCTSWISRLITLELAFLPLQQKDIECVMSGGMNLTSLSLNLCHFQNPINSAINVDLPRLKELIITGHYGLLELNCPNLESFEFSSTIDCYKFSNVPLLTKVTFSCGYNCSFIFDKLARHVPNLQAMKIYVCTKVHVQPLPSNSTMSRIKWLFLSFGPPGSDVLSITYLLNACPFLEILHMLVLKLDFRVQNPRRQYIDCPHFHLKEVDIQGYRAWDFMECARYLLYNAVALARMVINDDCGCSSTREEMGSNKCTLRNEEMADATSYCFEEVPTSYCSSRREEMATILLQNIQTNAELVFQTRPRRTVLNASNRPGYGVHLVYPES